MAALSTLAEKPIDGRGRHSPLLSTDREENLNGAQMQVQVQMQMQVQMQVRAQRRNLPTAAVVAGSSVPNCNPTLNSSPLKMQ